MDGKQLEIQSGDALPINDRIYRHGLEDDKEIKEDKYIPRTHFFDLNEPDKKAGYKLSVDWEQKTTPEEVIIRVGCTYKSNSSPIEFKNYKNRIIYALDVNFLNSLNEIIDVVYNPILNTKKKKGSPDNPAHSLIGFDKEQYKQNRPFLLKELREHAQDKKIEFNMQTVDKAVVKYRNS